MKTPPPQPDIIRKLDTLRDMDPRPIGHLHNGHLGLHIYLDRKPHPMYGQLIEIHHGYHTTGIKTRWNGLLDEHRTHPHHTIRLETTMEQP